MRGMTKSPAELALGRPLRDTLPLPPERYKVNNQWKHFLEDREVALSKHNDSNKTEYDKHSRTLPILDAGDIVLCQNVSNKKWDRSDTIVEVEANRQYKVKMDSSGSISKRNRRHLQKMSTKAIPEIPVTYKANRPDENCDKTPVNAPNNRSTTSVPLTLVGEQVISDHLDDKSDIKNRENVVPTLRRSKRIPKAPVYYHDKYNL